MIKVGVLALQGAVNAHHEKLKELDVSYVEVKTPTDLDNLSGIILPGGESTAMLHLLHKNHLFEPLKKYVMQKPSFGVCAGMILLAESVVNPSQESLKAISIEVARNGYGRQIQSFIEPLSATTEGAVIDLGSKTESIEGVFIRAPRVKKWGGSVKVLFKWHDEPVMLKDKHVLVSSFHPELTDSLAIHRFFVSMCKNSYE